MQWWISIILPLSDIFNCFAPPLTPTEHMFKYKRRYIFCECVWCAGVCVSCVCLHVCVCQCLTLVITCRLGLRCADKASCACWKALFFQFLFRGSSNLKVTCQSVSYTLRASIHLSSTIYSQNIYDLCSSLWETCYQFMCLKRASIFMVKSSKRAILSWWNNTLLYEDNKNTWIVAIYFSFRSTFLWGSKCCYNGRVMKSTLNRWQSKSFVLNLTDTHSSARIKVWLFKCSLLR